MHVFISCLYSRTLLLHAVLTTLITCCSANSSHILSIHTYLDISLLYSALLLCQSKVTLQRNALMCCLLDMLAVCVDANHADTLSVNISMALLPTSQCASICFCLTTFAYAGCPQGSSCFCLTKFCICFTKQHLSLHSSILLSSVAFSFCFNLVLGRSWKLYYHLLVCLFSFFCSLRKRFLCFPFFFACNILLSIVCIRKTRGYLFEGKRAFCACIGISSLVPCW